MCKYCENSEEKLNKDCSYSYIDKYDNKHYLIFDNSGREYKEGKTEINYCPICGRKLGD